MKKTYMIVASVLAIAVGGGLVAHAEGNKRDGKMKFNKGFMMQNMLEELDTDGDGKVSKEEITVARTAKFQEADANSDGQLTQAELEAFKAAEKERREAERKKKKFEALDADGNGSASLEEFLAARPEAFDRMDRNDDGFLSEDDYRRKGKWKDK